MTQTTRSKLSRAGKGEQAWRNGPGEEGWMSLLTYRRDHMEGCFASALGCFYLLALPGCLPHSFHACVAPPASSGGGGGGGGGTHFQPLPNLQEQIIRPFFWHRKKVLKKCVCCNVRVLSLIFALSRRFFLFLSRARTQFDLICIFPARITLAAYLSNTCHLGGSTKS